MSESDLYDFSLWRATVTMASLTGLAVEVNNPHGMTVCQYVLDPAVMWRLKDVKPTRVKIESDGISCRDTDLHALPDARTYMDSTYLTCSKCDAWFVVCSIAEEGIYSRHWVKRAPSVKDVER